MECAYDFASLNRLAVKGGSANFDVDGCLSVHGVRIGVHSGKGVFAVMWRITFNLVASNHFGLNAGWTPENLRRLHSA